MRAVIARHSRAFVFVAACALAGSFLITTPSPAGAQDVTRDLRTIADDLLSNTSLIVWLLVAFVGIGLVYTGWRAVQLTKRQQEMPAAIEARDDAPEQKGLSELARAFGRSKGALIAVALFSGLINVLMLTGAFFMLEVYDRVLPSRSEATLIALALLALFLFLSQGLLDIIRNRLLVRIGAAFDNQIGPKVFSATYRLPAHVTNGDGLQPLRDHDRIRSFVSSPGPVAFFDLPWMPIYLAVIFALHPLLGWTALGGAVVLAIMTVASEFFTKRPLMEAAGASQERYRIAESANQNADIIRSMGMSKRMTDRWSAFNNKHLDRNNEATDISGGLSSSAKSLRLILQSAVLGVGAWLVIHQQATAGVIIAGSILTSRALNPLDQAIAHWKNFVASRQSWARLSKQLTRLEQRDEPMPLPPPSKTLRLRNIVARAPTDGTAIVKDVSFELKAGDAVGVIGPSGCGKSTLVQVVAGLWPIQPPSAVLLDGGELQQWSEDAIGGFVGYLPQVVTMIEGTIAQNIARFEPEAPSEKIIAAARAAGVHDLIMADFPKGYETEVGQQGARLSAGQRQRIGLARALYGEPFLVILDEPNSNLDSPGDEALTRAIVGVRKRGGVVLVVAHRPSALAAVNLAAAMQKGTLVAFGPRDEVLATLTKRPPNDPGPTSGGPGPGPVGGGGSGSGGRTGTVIPPSKPTSPPTNRLPPGRQPDGPTMPPPG
ncbi:MAG: type I secretion system permease/ATPase, partial [Pseudomonadota bacterium]